MPEIKSIESLSYVIAFVVPGLIIVFVRSQFLTGRTPPHTDAILSYLVLTLIYYGLVFPFVEYVLRLEKPEWTRALAWFALVIVGPAVFGVILGLGALFGPIRRLMRKFGLNPVHPSPTAWDWRFSGLSEQWVIVTLKDDTKFGGWCGRNSFFSSDPNERDAYIEKIYALEEDGTWTDSGQKGLFIAPGEIRTLEFLPVNRGDRVNERQTTDTDKHSRVSAKAGGTVESGNCGKRSAQPPRRPPAGDGIEPAEQSAEPR